MQKISFLLSLCIIFCATTNFRPCFARKNKEIKFTKLENITDSNLELFVKDDNLKQNIETQPARLNLNFDASSLIKNKFYPTSFKIEIYDIRDTQRNLLGIFRPSIFNAKKAENFKTELELLNLTQDSDLEIDIFDTNNNLYSSFKLSIEIDNGQTISFSNLTDSNCTASFGQCQLEYIFNNVHLTTLPSAKLQTKIEKNTDGTYTVNLPLFKSKTINVRNKIRTGSGTDQDFDFDFDGSNLFVIKDGVSTLIGAQGPAGEKGESGSSGAPGGFSGGDATINGVLTFVSNGRLEDAFFNGASFVTTSNNAEVPFTVKGAVGQTANLTEWQDANGTTLMSISEAGAITSKTTLSIDKTRTNETNYESIKIDPTTDAATFRIGSSIGSNGGTTRPIEIGGWTNIGTFIPWLRFYGVTGYTSPSDHWAFDMNTPGLSGRLHYISPGGTTRMSLVGRSDQQALVFSSTPTIGKGNHDNNASRTAIVYYNDGVMRTSSTNAGSSPITTFFQLDGATSSFPAFTRSGATFALRLADNSGDAPLTAGAASFNGKVSISDTMNLAPRSSPPASPSMGDLYVDSDNGELCYYNGSVWTGMVAGGACS